MTDSTADLQPGEVPWLSQEDVPVETYRILSADGSYDPEAVPDLDDEELVDLYRWMLREKRYGERMVSLQRRGDMGTVATARGQEASIVGSGYALDEREDWLMGMGRETAAMLLQGASIRDMILYWRGIEDAARSLAENRISISISVGSQMPMTAGIAWGMDLLGDDGVVTAYFGDGATSTGAFHEGVNFAGVLEVPALFYCQNNQWAISTPFEKQTAAETVAQGALGYGIDGLRVDGNDVLAVYRAMAEARERARRGEPVLVESLTYRMEAHTTSDDPSRYRDPEELEEWKERDPLPRYREFLKAEGLYERVDEDEVLASFDEEFDAAVEAADEFEHRDPEEIFAHLYGELPPTLQDQLEELEAFLEEHPEATEYVEQRPKG